MTVGPFRLSEALHELILDKTRALAFCDGDRSAIPAGLDDDDRELLERRDLVGLYRAGAHPLLVFHLSAILNDRSFYVRNVVPQLSGVPNWFYDYYNSRRGGEEGGWAES